MIICVFTVITLCKMDYEGNRLWGDGRTVLYNRIPSNTEQFVLRMVVMYLYMDSFNMVDHSLFLPHISPADKICRTTTLLDNQYSQANAGGHMAEYRICGMEL